MFTLLMLFCWWRLFTVLRCHEPVLDTSERVLVRHLLENYDTTGRPVQTGNEAIIVFVELDLQQVVDLDEKNQVLLSSLLIQLKWHDVSLYRRIHAHFGDNNGSQPNHNGKMPSGENEVIVALPASKIWTPDLYVYNNAADGRNGLIHVNESRVQISGRGEVTWKLPVTVQSSCSVNVQYFPFDHQVCEIRLASWAYDQRQVLLRSFVKNSVPPGLGNTIENMEFVIAGVKLHENNHTNFDGQLFSQIVFKLHIRRRALFYAYTVIAPSILLCILSVISFCLPSANAKKVDIGLTVYLFLYFLQVMIAENTPESNSPPLIGMFLTTVLSLNSLSIIFATYVLNLTAKTRSSPCPAPPCLLWFLVVNVFGKLTMTSHDLSETLFHMRHNAAPLFFGVRTPNKPDRSIGTTNQTVHQIKTQRTVDRERRYQWVYIARVTDRVLFLLYSLATFTLLFMFLIYFPSSVVVNF
ncbi:Acetylcholine receptor subunit alpha-type acr-16 [Paragonimus heterotremus]|uniref:Acetylcholine receptor subunit alpha-type acr-16 n=1 Tax=Paragonimus heterotremus TaxID=100268 RepID=A0A8J4X324_9TREM|nr:Acetylcholine receptor subunit alpha-type acr-16 [Paragonimus heterotremus]